MKIFIKVYTLYRWNLTPWGLAMPPHQRGSAVAVTHTYKDLVAEGQRRTLLAGYPKGQWMYLFDWGWTKMAAIAPPVRKKKKKGAVRGAARPRRKAS